MQTTLKNLLNKDKLLSHRKIMKAGFFLLLAFCVLFIFIFFTKTSRTLSVQAQEYLGVVMPDFQSLQDKLHFYQGGFVKLSTNLPTVKEAFFEISSSHDYFSAVDDTAQDIKDIRTTLQMIDEALLDKNQATPPAELKELDTYLETYYQDAKRSMETLLEFEEFQQEMLFASGDNLNRDVERFGVLVNKAGAEGLPLSEMNEFVALLKSIADEGNMAVKRYATMTSIPENRLVFHNLQKDYHEDIARTFQQNYDLLIRNEENDQSTWIPPLSSSLSDFMKRNSERQKEIKADTESWIKSSDIKNRFSEMDDLEKKITKYIEEFPTLIPTTITPTLIEEITPPEASISAQPSTIVSPSVIPEVTLDPLPITSSSAI